MKLESLSTNRPACLLTRFKQSSMHADISMDLEVLIGSSAPNAR